ncbi:MAG TPA: cupin domain-containing protein [Solirubrobacteraceae bacterium]|nr:cupin domain-containing protein [Solirubrobacteraceae bacterium]
MTTAADSAERAGSFDALPADEPFPGVRRESFTTERATVTRYTFAPGAAFPLHRHPQEQTTLILEGAVEMTVRSERRALRAGDWSVVGPDVEHGITAGADGARIIAIIAPPRTSIDEYEIRAGGGQ